MYITKYLVISAGEGRYGGLHPKVALKEREPKLKGNELSVKISLEVPDAIFRRPKLEARMVVPNEAVPKTVLTPEITTNIEKIIKEATGLKMVVSIVDQAEEKIT